MTVNDCESPRVLSLRLQVNFSKQVSVQIWNLQIRSVSLYFQLGEGESFERAVSGHKGHWTQSQAMAWEIDWLCSRLAM